MDALRAGALSLADDGTAVTVTAAGPHGGAPAHLATYVYRPDVPADESPRPYLHPVRTLSGVLVTDFRPADHRWHHGISLALPYVGGANLWGGPTWVREQGAYVTAPVNGSMRHVRFVELPARRAQPRLSEDLTWHDHAGGLLARERRDLTFTLDALESRGWSLSWRSAVVNTSGGPLAFGSPATHGRVGAPYAGIFWRAAPAFADAAVRASRSQEGRSGEELMGTSSPWMAFTTTTTVPGHLPGHDAATIAMGDVSGPTSVAQPPRWFARSQEYPGFGPAPFGEVEVVLPPGEVLELGCRMVVADGDVRWSSGQVPGPFDQGEP